MSNDTVQVLAIQLDDTKFALKSQDSVTPIFKSKLSALAYKEYLESSEGGGFKVEILSDIVVMVSHDDADESEESGDSISRMFSSIAENVRTPHVQAVVEKIYTYEQMFLFENMWSINDRLEFTYL